jgi:hypothetical protein
VLFLDDLQWLDAGTLALLTERKTLRAAPLSAARHSRCY